MRLWMKEIGINSFERLKRHKLFKFKKNRLTFIACILYIELAKFVDLGVLVFCVPEFAVVALVTGAEQEVLADLVQRSASVFVIVEVLIVFELIGGTEQVACDHWAERRCEGWLVHRGAWLIVGRCEDRVLFGTVIIVRID